MNKCIFLDRDGVINVERGEYTYLVEDFVLEDGVIDILKKLKRKGFLLIIITNQGGINKGLYTVENVMKCHDHLQNYSGGIFDDIYYSPYHDNYTKSLSRKPNSLMLERAIYKWDVDVANSWMIGDSSRDFLAAVNVGLRTISVNKNAQKYAGLSFDSPADALEFIDDLKS